MPSNQSNTLDSFILKAHNVHSNRFDYSKSIWMGMRKKICIICQKHGEFWQIPYDHLRGYKCKQCGMEQKQIVLKKSGKDFFIKNAKAIHHDQYDYSSVEYITSGTKVKILCKKHNYFFNQTPNSHLQGIGCPNCGIDKIKSKLTNSTDEFISKAKEIKNNNIKYDYSKVEYISNKTKITIICNEHGEFQQTPNSHLSGNGCPTCGDIYRPLKSNTDDFISKCNSTHNNKYDYSKVIYNGCFKKIIILCKEHGEFQQQAWAHVTGQGCPLCSIKTRTKEQYILEANEIHNYKYSYKSINYVNMSKKINIICNKHGKFTKRPLDHLNGVGCPRCSKAISKAETEWLNYLNIKNKFRNISIYVNGVMVRPDGFDPGTNTVYEFYGDYWHGNPKVYERSMVNPTNKKTFGELYDRTIEREEELKKIGYKIVSIWECDWNKLKNEINRAA